jgi:hypothetical protein
VAEDLGQDLYHHRRIVVQSCQRQGVAACKVHKVLCSAAQAAAAAAFRRHPSRAPLAAVAAAAVGTGHRACMVCSAMHLRLLPCRLACGRRFLVGISSSRSSVPAQQLIADPGSISSQVGLEGQGVWRIRT